MTYFPIILPEVWIFKQRKVLLDDIMNTVCLLLPPRNDYVIVIVIIVILDVCVTAYS